MRDKLLNGRSREAFARGTLDWIHSGSFINNNGALGTTNGSSFAPGGTSDFAGLANDGRVVDNERGRPNGAGKVVHINEGKK